LKRFVACMLVAATPALGESLADFPFSADVAVKGGEGLHRVEVPFEVHRAAQVNLGDLRVFNKKGEMLPFAFAGIPAAAEPTREVVPLPLFPILAAPRGATSGDVSLDVRTNADGSLISLRTTPKAAPKPARAVAWVADASAVGKDVQAATFEWEAGPGREIVRVTLEASDDLKAWSALASGSLVRLEQDGRSLVQPRLEFAARKVKYLRVTSSTEGFVLTGLKVESSLAAPAPAVHAVTVGALKGQRPGEYTYDLQAAIPVARVQLILNEANVVAPVQLFSRNGDGAWRDVGSATFYRLTREGAEVRSKPIDVPPAPARYWMVRIDPKAGAPSEAPRLEAGYRSRQVVFASRGDGPYLLAFGNEQAKPANLPLATLIPGYERDAEYKLPAAQVGMVGAHAAPVGWRPDKKTLLWVVLVGGVLVLGFMAWRLSKK
jgi:hypothetical protein